MNLKNIFSVVLALSFSITARAAELVNSSADSTNTFSLAWILDEVRANNPLLKAARANWQAMQERVPQARAWEDPQASFDTTAGRFVQMMPNQMTDQRLMFEQKVPVAGKNRLRGKAASAEAVSAFEEFRRRELDLLAKARIAYFRLANAYAQLDLNQKNRGLLKQFSEITRAKYEVGAQSQADVLSAETELAKLDEAAFDFQRDLSDAQTQINVLMNRLPQTALPRPAQINFAPANFSREKIEALALAHRPELLMAQQKIEAAKWRVETAKRGKIPEPSFRIEGDRYNGAGQPISEVMVGFSINLPWFQRKKYDAAIRENKNMLEVAQRELESTEKETLGLVRDELKKLETFHHHTELFRSKIVPLAQETVASKRLNYETDKANFLDLLTAQRTVQEVESTYWMHLTDYQIALAELEALVGGKLQPTVENQQEKK